MCGAILRRCGGRRPISTSATSRYTQYYANELPERHRELVDVRRFGPGERFVFEPYTQDIYRRTQSWIDERGIFPPDEANAGTYEDAVIRLAAAD